MRIQPILDRLRPLKYKTLGGALEFIELRNLAGRLDALFIVPERGQAKPSPFLTSVVDQNIDEGFMAMMIIDRGRADIGTISEKFETRKTELIRCLATWTHPDSENLTQFVGWNLYSSDGNALTYAFNFKICTHFREIINGA